MRIVLYFSAVFWLVLAFSVAFLGYDPWYVIDVMAMVVAGIGAWALARSS